MLQAEWILGIKRNSKTQRQGLGKGEGVSVVKVKLEAIQSWLSANASYYFPTYSTKISTVFSFTIYLKFYFPK